MEGDRLIKSEEACFVFFFLYLSNYIYFLLYFLFIFTLLFFPFFYFTFYLVLTLLSIYYLLYILFICFYILFFSLINVIHETFEKGESVTIVLFCISYVLFTYSFFIHPFSTFFLTIVICLIASVCKALRNKDSPAWRRCQATTSLVVPKDFSISLFSERCQKGLTKGVNFY